MSTESAMVGGGRPVAACVRFLNEDGRGWVMRVWPTETAACTRGCGRVQSKTGIHWPFVGDYLGRQRPSTITKPRSQKRTSRFPATVGSSHSPTLQLPWGVEYTSKPSCVCVYQVSVTPPRLFPDDLSWGDWEGLLPPPQPLMGLTTLRSVKVMLPLVLLSSLRFHHLLSTVGGDQMQLQVRYSSRTIGGSK